MQRKILMILLVVSLFGIVSATVALYFIQTTMAYNKADELFALRFAEVEKQINKNEEQIVKLVDATKKDFISRARALAVMIELDPHIVNDIDKLNEIVDALDVDEVHIIDENGFLQWGTVPEYYGMDFTTTDQTRPFLDILDDPSLEIVQDPMPNGYKGLARQYAGVSLRGQKGIAQIGMVPERLAEALENNTIDKVLVNIAVGNEGYLISVDLDTNLISAHPDKSYIGTQQLHNADKGFISVEGVEKYYDSKLIGNQMISAVIPTSELFADRTLYTSIFLVFMIVIFGIFFFSVNTYMRRSVVRGILETVDTLGRITGGDLGVVADVRINDEFTKLSDGINHMVLSINEQIAEITALAEDKGRLAAIVSMADAGVIVKDKDGVVTEWNIGAENILGYKPDEIIGKTTHYYAPEESHSGINDMEVKLKAGESIVRADVVRKHKDGMIIDCSSSYTPIFNEENEFVGSVAIFHDISDKKRLELDLKKAISIAEEKHMAVMAGIEYSRKIQKNLLPRASALKKAFSDYSVIWKPRDVVGGDIYWMKQFETGAVLVVADCTGHGTPGALLTMLVVSALENVVLPSNCHDTAEIIWGLENRLVDVFSVKSDRHVADKDDIQDGCDLAVLFIANDGSINLSAGHTNVYVCDGKEVKRIRGQKLYVGEGKINGKDEIKTVHIPHNPDNKFYIASDGLSDQSGWKTDEPFGYTALGEITLANHEKPLSEITDIVWAVFEEHRGNKLRLDDFELVAFKPKGGI